MELPTCSPDLGNMRMGVAGRLILTQTAGKLPIEGGLPKGFPAFRLWAFETSPRVLRNGAFILAERVARAFQPAFLVCFHGFSQAGKPAPLISQDPRHRLNRLGFCLTLPPAWFLIGRIDGTHPWRAPARKREGRSSALRTRETR